MRNPADRFKQNVIAQFLRAWEQLFTPFHISAHDSRFIKNQKDSFLSKNQKNQKNQPFDSNQPSSYPHLPKVILQQPLAHRAWIARLMAPILRKPVSLCRYFEIPCRQSPLELDHDSIGVRIRFYVR